MTKRNLSFIIIAVSIFLMFAIPWAVSLLIDQRDQSALSRNIVFTSNWLTLLGACVGLGILYRTLAPRSRGIFLIIASFAFLFFGAVLIPNIIDRRNPEHGFGLRQALSFLLLAVFLLGVGGGVLLIYRSKRKVS